MLLKKLRQGYKRIIAYSLVLLVIGLTVSLLQPQLYRSRSKLLVTMYGNDYYAIDKGNQYFASLLPKIASSQSFFNDLFSGSADTYGLDRAYFGSTYREEMRAWERTMSISMDAQGILTVDIYHSNPEQAKQISMALDNYLIAKESYFQQLADKADIKIIDQPIVSRYPVKPDLAGNAVAAMILGALIGAAMELSRSGEKKKKTDKAVKEAKTEYIPVKDMDFLKDNVVVEIKEGTPERQPAPVDTDNHFRGNIGNVMN